MSSDSAESELDSLSSTKDQLKIQQQLIDISLRNLQTQRDHSPCPRSTCGAGEVQATLVENILFHENKLLKVFSRQLLAKHRFIEQTSRGGDVTYSQEKLDGELDQCISLDLFLNVAELSTRTIKLLLDSSWSLDKLFTMYQMQQAYLKQQLTKLDISSGDMDSLLRHMGRLASFYAAENGGGSHPSLAPTKSMSVGEQESKGEAQAGPLASASPLGGHASPPTSATSSPPHGASAQPPTSHHIPFSPRRLTPSSHSLISIPIPSPPVLLRNSSAGALPLADPDSHNIRKTSYSGYPSNQQPKMPVEVFSRTHKRSKSNPLSHIITGTAHPQARMRTPSPPPLRADSHPTIAMTTIQSTSPPVSKSKIRRRPPLSSSKMHSLDLGMNAGHSTPVVASNLRPSSPLTQFSTIIDVLSPGDRGLPRCNSLAVPPVEGERAGNSVTHESKMASTSMVNLSLGHGYSDERLDQDSSRVEENQLPKTGKSQSVPRLALLSVGQDDAQNGGQSSVPTSPRTPHTPGLYTPTGHMGHAICHRFSSKTFLTPHQCDYCKRKAFGSFMKCKDCKYTCHKSCATKVPPACGLPQGLMDFFRQQLRQKTSSSGQCVDTTASRHAPAQQSPDLKREGPYQRTNGYVLTSQNSTSSMLEVPHIHHHSSTSSSPSASPLSSPCSLLPSSPRSPNNKSTYTFPAPPTVMDDSTDEFEEDACRAHHRLSNVEAHSSQNSADYTDSTRVNQHNPRGLRPPPQVVSAKSLPDLLAANGRKSTDSSDGAAESYTSNRELRQTSIRKRESLGKTLSTGDSGTSTLIPTEEDELEERSDGDNEDDEYNRTPHMRMHRNSVIDEWSIPYDEIKVLECIGHGPVGEVYKGYWHGDVAIKKFHLPDATADQLDSFKEEASVSILKKTRHENVALFMGASLIPPNLAIVTSFCRGHILYKHLHIWSELFPLEKSLSIANQVAHGLGYLHARNIVHKDLNTKNIFLDKDKVVITDLGISSLGDTMRLSNQQRGSPGLRCERRCAIIPRTRLYYMAPEIVRLLSASPDVHPDSGDVYPYSYKTDVYAFGTVVYELLTKRFPFTTDHLGIPLDVASVIFMVGCGSRQDIKCAVPKKLKELVWKCWEKDPEQRPAMGIVSDVLAKLLSRKGYPARSPSFPTNLSKSAENLLAI
ncbi:hypothetical protein EMCRGX_G023906 [Ephydatia muelleri]